MKLDRVVRFPLKSKLSEKIIKLLNGVSIDKGEDRAMNSDIAAGRLPADQYLDNFSDIASVLNTWEASVESERCLYCFDAPCVEACPTDIDIPNFIRKISNGNVKGAAVEILKANILGGSCSRVCPTEILCEQKCVRMDKEGKPVLIGKLQRFSTDFLMASGVQPFQRAPLSGKTVAIVGAGPASLSCAHRLASHGHNVDIFEAREKAGGLNEYGIASYKMVDNFAQRETDFILAIGGIDLHFGQRLGDNLKLDQLRADFDAVFIGIGLGGSNEVGLDGEDLDGIMDAVDYIGDLRQSADLTSLAIGRRVVVIGGGNTAVDMAIQAKLLGAEDVTMVYRRGPEQMGATEHEQELAQTRDVRIRFWAKPVKFVGENGAVTAVEFERTALDADGRVTGTGDHYTIDADMVFKAVGQKLLPFSTHGDAPDRDGGRFKVDENYQTSLPGVYAGGDCVEGLDLTVEAVQDGKLAAEAIHRQLTQSDGGSSNG